MGEMVNKIFAYFGSLIAIFVTIVGLFLYGKNKGRKEEQNIRANEALDDIIEAKNKNDEISTIDINIIRKRMQNRWTYK